MNGIRFPATDDLACRTGVIFAYFRWAEAKAKRTRSVSRARREEKVLKK